MQKSTKVTYSQTVLADRATLAASSLSSKMLYVSNHTKCRRKKRNHKVTSTMRFSQHHLDCTWRKCRAGTDGGCTLGNLNSAKTISGATMGALYRSIPQTD
jgi:hypothetical protein